MSPLSNSGVILAFSKIELLDIYGLLDRVQVKGIKEVEALVVILKKVRDEVKALEVEEEEE